MRYSKNVGLLVVITLLGGCASVDAQDRYILGAANRANVAAQSERSVDLANSKKVESTSGVRAVNAMKALDEGQTKELASAGTGGAE